MKVMALIALTTGFIASTASAQDLTSLIPGGDSAHTITILLGSLAALNAVSIGLEKLAELTPSKEDDLVVGKLVTGLQTVSKFVNFFIGKR